MSYKQKRREISEPDQFLKTSSAYWGMAAANRKLIIAVAAGLLSLAIVVIVVSNVMKAKVQASGEAFSAALALAERPVQGDVSALSAPADVTPFATRQAKYEALEAAFQKLRDEHAGTRAAQSAAYYLADAQMQLGKVEAADELYAAYVGSAKAGAPLRLMALEGRGYAAEKRGDAVAALSFFEQLGREAQGEQWQARAAYHRARMLVLQGKKAEAAEAFERIGKDFSKATAMGALAKERLALLASEGIRPAVEPPPAAAVAQPAK